VWLAEAALQLGLSKSTLYTYRCTGEGPQGVLFGRKVAYRKADIDRHLDAAYTAATAANSEARPAEPRRQRLAA
jgi:predicted DNA-binding transcriptional regulator AlpA